MRKTRATRPEVYKPETMRPTLQRQHVLQLELGSKDDETGEWTHVKTASLLLDHGKVMHLYAIRWPQMDAVYPPASRR